MKKQLAVLLAAVLLFAAAVNVSAEYAKWKKDGKSLPKFLGETTETDV